MEPWEAAYQYKGVRFRHRGRTRNGLDCAGLLIVAARDLGYDPVDLSVYGRHPYEDGLYNYLVANLGEPVDREPQVNDVILMRRFPQDDPSHMGIIAPYPEENELALVHTYAAIGYVVKHRLDNTWRSRIVNVFGWYKD